MKYFLTIILGFVLTRVYSQETPFFHFDRLTYHQIDSIEADKQSVERFVSYTISVSPDYFPNAAKLDLAQPRIFDRPRKEDFISCQVEYFYTKSDSIVRLISYTWDTKNTATTLEDLMKPEHNQSGRIEKYSSEFDVIANHITTPLGNPTKGTGQIVKKQKKGFPDWYERKYIWKKDDTTVELFMIWSERKGALGTYKLRTKVYWKH